MTARKPRGVTLVELLVVLAILGVMAGVVGLTWQPGARNRGIASRTAGSLPALRRSAFESGRAMGGLITVDGHVARVIAFPDGRVLGAEQLEVNPLNGKVRDAAAPYR